MWPLQIPTFLTKLGAAGGLIPPINPVGEAAPLFSNLIAVGGRLWLLDLLNLLSLPRDLRSRAFTTALAWG